MKTTSKQLTWFVSVVWAMTIFSAVCALIIYDVNLMPLVYAVSASYGIVLSSYFNKAKVENKAKIEKTNNLKGE